VEINKVWILKLKDTDFYKLKSGRFRVIYRKENKEMIIDGIKLRN